MNDEWTWGKVAAYGAGAVVVGAAPFLVLWAVVASLI